MTFLCNGTPPGICVCGLNCTKADNFDCIYVKEK